MKQPPRNGFPTLRRSTRFSGGHFGPADDENLSARSLGGSRYTRWGGGVVRSSFSTETGKDQKHLG